MTPRAFLDLFDEFAAPSWARWREVLAGVGPGVRELFVVAGRGSGKSRVAALVAASFACREYRRAPGERVFVGVFAPDRRQARVTFDYVRGLLLAVPELAGLVESDGSERLELRGGVVVEVLTASRAAPRGRSYACAVVEEASFLPTDDTSAEPDVELVRALRPALARVPGALLAVIGSPYRRAGVLYDAWLAGSSEDRLVVAGDTLSFNPSFAAREVERAFAQDPVAAASEYGRGGAVEFRSDVAALLDEPALAAVVAAGEREVAPPPPGGPWPAVVAHFDAATGSGADAAALAVAERGGDGSARLLAARRWAPPFDPSAVVAEAAGLLGAWGLSAVTVDRFAPGLVAALFREVGVACAPAPLDTSAAFVELLGLVNSRRVRLLDDPALLGELRRLERRPTSGGRERVGHPERSGAHDDLAAAAAQALVAAAGPPGSAVAFGEEEAAAGDAELLALYRSMLYPPMACESEGAAARRVRAAAVQFYGALAFDPSRLRDAMLGMPTHKVNALLAGLRDARAAGEVPEPAVPPAWRPSDAELRAMSDDELARRIRGVRYGTA